MKKRWIPIVIVLALLCAVLPRVALPVLAETYSAAYGEDMTWSFDDETGLLVIEGDGPILDADTAEDFPWLSYAQDSIRAICLGEGITAVGKAAFLRCSALEELSIPESVSAIGAKAFYQCPALTEVTIPSGVTEIAACAFGYLDEAAELKVDGFTVFGYEDSAAQAYAVENDFNFVPIRVQRPLSGSCGAAGDNLLWTLDPETGLLAITGSGAMADYSQTNAAPWAEYRAQIRALSLPDGLTRIGDRALCDCAALTAFTLPGGLREIGAEAFSGSGYALAQRNWENGLLYYGAWLLEAKSSLTSATVRDETKWIADGAFGGCKLLKEVKLPDNVQSIGYHALGFVRGAQGNTKLDGFTVYGFPDTVAESYAAEHGFRFVSLLVENPFVDVKPKDWYYDAVLWAVSHGITGGVDATHFGPKKNCTREQVVTFLYAANGSPAPESTDNPFVDVKKKHYFYRAVLWAVENGITGGVDATHFGVGVECSRAQVVMFLWAAEGKPEPQTTNNPFTDVKKKDYFYKAVLWAVENGITGGSTPTTFSPKAICNRAQVVTFLYAAYGKEG